MPVGDVPVGQLHASINSIVGVDNVMMLFISLLDIMKDMDSLINRCGFYYNFLEPSFQSSVLLNMLPVLVEGSGTDALYLTSCQRRLQHVGCIQGACCATCAYNGMDLINEKNYVVILGELIKDGFHPFLKLAPVFGAGHN